MHQGGKDELLGKHIHTDLSQPWITNQRTAGRHQPPLQHNKQNKNHTTTYMRRYRKPTQGIHVI